MTILVTGATGNIGRCVVDRLVGAGQRVRAMTRDLRTARLAPEVEVVYGGCAPTDRHLPAAHRTAAAHLRAVGP